MQDFEIKPYAGKYPEKLRALMARWNLSEFEAAQKVVETYYSNLGYSLNTIHRFGSYQDNDVFRVFDCIQDGIAAIRKGITYRKVDLSSGVYDGIEVAATLDVYEGCY